MNKKMILIVLGANLAFAAAPPVTGPRDARAEGKLQGRAFITKTRLSPSGQPILASTARQAEVHMVWPTEETGNDNTTWNVPYVLLFEQPLGDYEVELEFFDVTKGPARYVDSREQLTRDKQTKLISGQASLSSPEFERNRRYLMRVKARHRPLAEVTFWLRGTPPRYDGRVRFDDEDVAPIKK